MKEKKTKFIQTQLEDSMIRKKRRMLLKAESNLIVTKKEFAKDNEGFQFEMNKKRQEEKIKLQLQKAMELKAQEANDVEILEKQNDILDLKESMDHAKRFFA